MVAARRRLPSLLHSFGLLRGGDNEIQTSKRGGDGNTDDSTVYCVRAQGIMC